MTEVSLGYIRSAVQKRPSRIELTGIEKARSGAVEDMDGHINGGIKLLGVHARIQ
jgi:hypothetical protein